MDRERHKEICADSEDSVLTPNGSESSDILQRKGEPYPAFLPLAQIGLHEFQAQSVAVEIIAKLSDRLLEK
jgi:hypothetical protein